MTTKNPRVNITLNPEDLEVIKILAAKKHMSQAALMKKMIEDWLDEYEELKLSEAAEQAYEHWIKTGKKTYTHEEIWKMLNIE